MVRQVLSLLNSTLSASFDPFLSYQANLCAAVFLGLRQRLLASCGEPRKLRAGHTPDSVCRLRVFLLWHSICRAHSFIFATAAWRALAQPLLQLADTRRTLQRFAGLPFWWWRPPHRRQRRRHTLAGICGPFPSSVRRMSSPHWAWSGAAVHCTRLCSHTRSVHLSTLCRPCLQQSSSGP